MPLARAEAERALKLSPSEPRAHTLLGIVAAVYDYDWKKAEEHFQRAMAAHVVPPEVRARQALYNLLPRGRLQAAICELEQVLVEDPLNSLASSYLSFCLNSSGMYERSLIEAQKTLEIDERSWLSHNTMAESYLAQKMFPEAFESAEKAYRLAPWHPYCGGFLAGLCSRAGDELRAKELLVRLSPIGMMSYHLLRSEIDIAADWYEQSIEQREPFAVLFSARSLIKPLRASPRWPALTKMMKLPVQG
jgi:tetratricopeptide (TPR) repeat protein